MPKRIVKFPKVDFTGRITDIVDEGYRVKMVFSCKRRVKVGSNQNDDCVFRCYAYGAMYRVAMDFLKEGDLVTVDGEFVKYRGDKGQFLDYVNITYLDFEQGHEVEQDYPELFTGGEF